MNIEQLSNFIDDYRIQCMKVIFDDAAAKYESGMHTRLPSLPGYSWPQGPRGPLWCALHIKVSELPYVPKRIQGYDYITMFLDKNYVEYGSQSHEGGEFLIRCIERGSEVILIDHPQPELCHTKKCRFELIDDFPDTDDIMEYLHNNGFEFDRESVFNASKLKRTVEGVKINGYPPTIQGPSDGAYGYDEFGIIIDLNDDLELKFGDSIVFNAGWSDYHNNWYSSWDTC